MTVIGTANGAEIYRDPYDLDYIQLDVVQDLVRTIEDEESNPHAVVEVDLTSPDRPSYQLKGCSKTFEDKFFDMIDQK